MNICMDLKVRLEISDRWIRPMKTQGNMISSYRYIADCLFVHLDFLFTTVEFLF